MKKNIHNESWYRSASLVMSLIIKFLAKSKWDMESATSATFDIRSFILKHSGLSSEEEAETLIQNMKYSANTRKYWVYILSLFPLYILLSVFLFPMDPRPYDNVDLVLLAIPIVLFLLLHIHYAKEKKRKTIRACQRLMLSNEYTVEEVLEKTKLLWEQPQWKTGGIIIPALLITTILGTTIYVAFPYLPHSAAFRLTDTFNYRQLWNKEKDPRTASIGDYWGDYDEDRLSCDTMSAVLALCSARGTNPFTEDEIAYAEKALCYDFFIEAADIVRKEDPSMGAQAEELLESVWKTGSPLVRYKTAILAMILVRDGLDERVALNYVQQLMTPEALSLNLEEVSPQLFRAVIALCPDEQFSQAFAACRAYHPAYSRFFALPAQRFALEKMHQYSLAYEDLDDAESFWFWWKNGNTHPQQLLEHETYVGQIDALNQLRKSSQSLDDYLLICANAAESGVHPSWIWKYGYYFEQLLTLPLHTRRAPEGQTYSALRCVPVLRILSSDMNGQLKSNYVYLLTSVINGIDAQYIPRSMGECDAILLYTLDFRQTEAKGYYKTFSCTESFSLIRYPDMTEFPLVDGPKTEAAHSDLMNELDLYEFDYDDAFLNAAYERARTAMHDKWVSMIHAAKQ